MRVAVTGATGFVGRNLVPFLVDGIGAARPSAGGSW
jgi:uncharacterized protein YbjT (DUF2867 family)